MEIEIKRLASHQIFICAIFVTEHDNVIKWKHSQRYWPFVRGMHQWPVDSLHKGQWSGFFMFWSAPEQTVEQTIELRWFETPSSSSWRHCNGIQKSHRVLYYGAARASGNISFLPHNRHTVSVLLALCGGIYWPRDSNARPLTIPLL